MVDRSLSSHSGGEGRALYMRWLELFREQHGLNPHPSPADAWEAQSEESRAAWGQLARELRDAYGDVERVPA